MRKSATAFAIVALLGFVSTSGLAVAQTSNVQSQINALLAEVKQLEAQIAEIQVNATSPNTTLCFILSQTLSFGSMDTGTGGQVSELQRFLGIIPTTGYFGLITQSALEKWQASEGIVSAGTPETTGYGSVGPRTRAAIGASCAPSSVPVTIPAVPSIPLQPSGPSGGPGPVPVTIPQIPPVVSPIVVPAATTSPTSTLPVVVVPPPAPPLPTISISADQSSITLDQSTTIRASFTTGTSDMLTVNDINVVPPGGVEANAILTGAGQSQALQNPLTYAFKPTTTGIYTFKTYALTSYYAYPKWQTGPSVAVTVSNTSQVCPSGDTGTYPNCVAPPPPTIDDFWNGTANFEFVRKQIYPSADIPNNTTQGVANNAQSYIVVVGNTWYRFQREQMSTGTYTLGTTSPSLRCSAFAPYGPPLRIVVYQSNDQGVTWTNRTVVVEPTEGTAWECDAIDGTPFFDPDTTTWHYVFQCLSAEGAWGICHAYRQSADPIGPWSTTPDAVINSGQIMTAMGLPQYNDEGTPQIVEKSNGVFYMTFHAFDQSNGYGVRAEASSQDLIHWLPTTSTPIFTSADCADWNVSWTGGCIGGGWADTNIIGNYYYVLIEAADNSLECGNGSQNHHWVYGLLRATNIITPTWQELPGGPGIIYNSAQQPNANVCGDDYAQIFTSGNDIYLMYMREEDTAGSLDTDPNTGEYYYKLVSGGPVASYTFPQGIPADNYAESDAISRGDLEASVANVTWLNPGLGMNGTNSVVTLPQNPVLQRTAPWSLDLSFTLAATPNSKSAFLAGDHGAGWLEADPYNGSLSLCAWVQSAQGPQNICTMQSLNVPTDATLIVTPTSFSLSVNGSVVATKPATGVPGISIITSGSAGATSGGYYGSWQGTLSRLSFYDYAVQNSGN